MRVSLDLTPKQYDLLRMLLREEANTNRNGDAFRARTILTKMGED